MVSDGNYHTIIKPFDPTPTEKNGELYGKLLQAPGRFSCYFAGRIFWRVENMKMISTRLAEGNHIRKFRDEGFAIVEDVLSKSRVKKAQKLVSRFFLEGAGSRNILEDEWCRDLVIQIKGHPAIGKIVGPDSACVQCTLFKKKYRQKLAAPPTSRPLYSTDGKIRKTGVARLVHQRRKSFCGTSGNCIVPVGRGSDSFGRKHIGERPT